MDAAMKLMAEHRSRRSFSEDELPVEVLRECVDVARHASTSSLLQAYSVIVVRDQERRQSLYEICSQQKMILNAPCFVAICVDLHRLSKACERAGKMPCEIDLESLVLGLADASLLAQNLILALESQGFGGCFVGAARNHPVEMAKLLALPPRVFVAFGLVAGRPVDDPLPRPRLPLEAILHEEVYDDSNIAEQLAEMDVRQQAWARQTNAEKDGYAGRMIHEDRGWCERVSHRLQVDRPAAPRDRLREELHLLGFSAI